MFAGDFVANTDMLVFNCEVSQATIQVQTFEDGLDEENETFEVILSLSPNSSANNLILSPQILNITIINCKNILHYIWYYIRQLQVSRKMLIILDCVWAIDDSDEIFVL